MWPFRATSSYERRHRSLALSLRGGTAANMRGRGFPGTNAAAAFTIWRIKKSIGMTSDALVGAQRTTHAKTHPSRSPCCRPNDRLGRNA